MCPTGTMPKATDSKYGKSNRSYKKLKIKLFNFLGGKCKICGIKDYDVLTIDHKYNDGYIDRSKMSAYTLRRFYLNNLNKAKRKLQLLCSNCNLKKEIYLYEFQRLERNGEIGF